MMTILEDWVESKTGFVRKNVLIDHWTRRDKPEGWGAKERDILMFRNEVFGQFVDEAIPEQPRDGRVNRNDDIFPNGVYGTPYIERYMSGIDIGEDEDRGVYIRSEISISGSGSNGSSDICYSGVYNKTNFQFINTGSIYDETPQEYNPASLPNIFAPRPFQDRNV